MIRSKLSFFIYPAITIVTIVFGSILFIEFILIVIDYKILYDLKSISLMMLLTTTFLFPLIAVWILARGYVVWNDRLEINYLFGVVKVFYSYKDLKISDYYWVTEGLLIEIPDGDQMTIGANQYKNFNKLKQSLEERIQKSKIEVKYTTRFTRTMFVIAAFSMLLFLISILIEK